MELVPHTPKERWEKANEAMSKHCFEAGRLQYAIELAQEDLERQKITLRNMRVDFDKLNKELRRSTEEFLQTQKAEKEPLPAELPQ